jgi:hypothetical protein
MSRKTQIERNTLIQLLDAWLLGTYDERQVHERAESIMDEMAEVPNFSENDPRSIPLEVLVHLDALNHQLITKEDIPIMHEFLSTPIGKEAEAWTRWRQYWDTLDMQTRRLQLQTNPYYSTEEF